jgi:hypothetical protein
MWILIICLFSVIQSLCVYNPTLGWIVITIVIILNIILFIFGYTSMNGSRIISSSSSSSSSSSEKSTPTPTLV